MKDQRLKQVYMTLEILRNAIQRGESMTNEVKLWDLNKAMDNVNNVDADLQAFQSYETECAEE